MTLGVAHFSAIALSPAELAKAATEAGFSRVGLRLFPAFPGAPCYALPQGSRDAADFAARLDATGLALFDIEFVVIDENFDPRSTCRVLADAAALGARRLSCCGADADPARLTDNLATLCAVAADLDISVWIVARGINIGLNTRMYFDDEDNSADPVLTLVEQAPRRETLLARKVKPGLYRFDIRLQGDGETVFLDI